MKKKDIQLLLIAFGILIAFLSWQFIYKGNQEKTEKLKAQNQTLQTTVNDLEVLEANRPQYEAEMKEMEQQCTTIANNFASGLTAEDEIMYLYNMELVDANEVKVPSVTMGEATEVPYASPTATSAPAATTDTNAAANTAAGSTEATTSVTQFQPVDEGIQMYSSLTTVSFTTSYGGLKNVIDYVYKIPSRKAISSVSLLVSENGYLSGTMELDFYCLTGTDVPYTAVRIPATPIGTDNIFGVMSGSQNTAGNGNNAEDAGGEAEEE